jgi:TolB-like protein/DNA-binding winged helix-turn-helix (wHTH) protein
METPPYTFGPFVLYPGRELQRDGKPVALGSRALSILETMLAADGAVVTKADLMARVWPGMIVEEGNISVQVAALRKELGTRPDGQDWIGTVPRIGYRIALPTLSAAPGPSGGMASVAVLPFANLSGDASQDYLGDGLVEDLITALSRFKTFAIVARNSSFAYKGKAIDARQVAAELGVRYLVEGSVRIAGNRVRVTAQLIDAMSGMHHWAESFDGDLGQIFEFQDRLTERVVGLVEPQIRRAEIERARRRWPDNPLAYDHFLRALPHFYGRAPDGFAQALEHLDRAIALEPDYATAMAYASWAYARKGTLAQTMLKPDQHERCLALARSALSFGADDPQVAAICSHSLIAIGHMKDEGLTRVRRALEANPYNVVVINQFGVCNMLVGDLADADTAFQRAYRLSPGGLEAHESLAGQGHCRLFMGDFASAAEILQRGLALSVDWPPIYWGLASAQAHLGRLQDARSTLERLKSVWPHFSIAGFQIVGRRSDERWSVLLEGLVRAGLE